MVVSSVHLIFRLQGIKTELKGASIQGYCVDVSLTEAKSFLSYCKTSYRWVFGLKNQLARLFCVCAGLKLSILVWWVFVAAGT